MAAQRRPVMSFKFRETPIKAVTEDLDGNTIYIGNGSGDLASVDIRTGTFFFIMCDFCFVQVVLRLWLLILLVEFIKGNYWDAFWENALEVLDQ